MSGTVYRVYAETPAKKELNVLLEEIFNRHAITTAQVEIDMNGALVTGITEEQAEKIGGSRGIASCQPEEGAQIIVPGFKSR